MKPLNKAIRTATIQGEDWRRVLYRFLLSYRATPHTSTGEPPAEVLFNQVIRSGVPAINEQYTTLVDVAERNKKVEKRMKRQQMHSCVINDRLPLTSFQNYKTKYTVRVKL